MPQERRSARRPESTIPRFEAEEVKTTNRAAVEMRSYGNHKTISTGPWKSRTEREIPTFPQADSTWLLRRSRTKLRRMNRPQSGSLSERRTGLLSERRLQLDRIRDGAHARELSWVLLVNELLEDEQ